MAGTRAPDWEAIKRAPKKRTPRLTYRTVEKLKPGQIAADPAVRNLRFIAQEKGTYAQWRYKHPLTGEWKSVGLGRLPGPEELEPIASAKLDSMGPNEHGFAGVTAHPDDILEAFRERVRSYERKLRAGLDPRSELGVGGFTLRQALSLHLQRLHNAGRSARTEDFYRLSLDRYLADWLDVPLRALSRTMVRERHQKIAKKAGPYAANGAMRTLRAVWNTAQEEDEKLSESPTAAVQWFKESRREAAIPLNDVATWFQEVCTLVERGPTAALRRDYYLLTLLTGLRRETASAIREEHINMAGQTLYVPKPKGGADRAFTLPLSDVAIAVVERRLTENSAWGPSPWLFPANSNTGHIVEPRCLASDGFTVPFTIHGLRHTYLSAAAAAGVSPYHAKLLANHSLARSDVTGGYVSADVDALRPSQQAITDYFKEHGLALAQPTFVEAVSVRKVVPIRRSR
jgi:integrase